MSRVNWVLGNSPGFIQHLVSLGGYGTLWGTLCEGSPSPEDWTSLTSACCLRDDSQLGWLPPGVGHPSSPLLHYSGVGLENDGERPGNISRETGMAGQIVGWPSRFPIPGWSNAGAMLARCLRRRANISPALFVCFSVGGIASLRDGKPGCHEPLLIMKSNPTSPWPPPPFYSPQPDTIYGYL